MKKELQSLHSLLVEGVKNPEKIPPYLRYLADPIVIHDRWNKVRYPSQTTKLDKFRENNRWALIVLDACRYDRFDLISSEYLDVKTQPIAAAAHNTFGYLRECWDGCYDVDYVTGAAPVTTQAFDFSKDSIKADGLVFENEELKQKYKGYIPTDHIENIIEVWRESWDESLGVCPPEPVTDRAVAMAPESTQLVVHYFQPHEPYIGEKKKDTRKCR